MYLNFFVAAHKLHLKDWIVLAAHDGKVIAGCHFPGVYFLLIKTYVMNDSSWKICLHFKINVFNCVDGLTPVIDIDAIYWST